MVLLGVQMDATYGMLAEHFSKFHGDRVDDLIVLPPYEPKPTTTPLVSVPAPVPQWVRGNIRVRNGQGGGSRDFVITAPPMKVLYGGCRWNRLVFALPGAANQPVYTFEKWIRNTVMPAVKAQIWAFPSRFKPGSQTNQRFVFDEGVLKPSSDPLQYPDELVTRLSVRKPLYDGDVDLVDTEFIQESADGVERVEPDNLTAGSVVQPVLKISYNRIGERFGLVLTVLKAKVLEINARTPAIQNSAWIIDSMDTSD